MLDGLAAPTARGLGLNAAAEPRQERLDLVLPLTGFLSKSPAIAQADLSPPRQTSPMQDWQRPQDRMEARETGTRLLRRVTTWIAVGSVAAVGLFGAIGWATIPGAAKTAQAA